MPEELPVQPPRCSQCGAPQRLDSMHRFDRLTKHELGRVVGWLSSHWRRLEKVDDDQIEQLSKALRAAAEAIDHAENCWPEIESV